MFFYHVDSKYSNETPFIYELVMIMQGKYISGDLANLEKCFDCVSFTQHKFSTIYFHG